MSSASAVYRVEIAKTGRAGCQATQCKKESEKIPKGELRHGVQVTIREHTSFMWRHWGCVTPRIIHNWAEISDMDMEMIDGYEVLPPDCQEKVKRALEQGHVDDDDWKGDIECNRLDPAKPQQGMFVKTPKKKKAKKDESDPEEDYPEDSPIKKKASKKRGRAQDDEDDEEEAETKPAPKKAKGRGKKAAAETVKQEDDEAAPAKKTRAPRKAAKPVEKASSETEAGDDPPPTKKSKAKKAAPKAAPARDEDVEEKPKKRRGRPKKAVSEDD
ncbi:uncharacterized protein LTR77_005654 [Saxophila tyrrhenica]|uniref:PARP-type domain-containing protein n=1 Tax=Saxophila tyrrhenica TaxID=1690608 RepID=A0AAV9P9C8_9PEZI|nr:hypothetical protein LTR77_005654 [Saxophila tyrrhenica]